MGRGEKMIENDEIKKLKKEMEEMKTKMEEMKTKMEEKSSQNCFQINKINLAKSPVCVTIKTEANRRKQKCQSNLITLQLNEIE